MFLLYIFVHHKFTSNAIDGNKSFHLLFICLYVQNDIIIIIIWRYKWLKIWKKGCTMGATDAEYYGYPRLPASSQANYSVGTLRQVVPRDKTLPPPILWVTTLRYFVILCAGIIRWPIGYQLFLKVCFFHWILHWGSLLGCNLIVSSKDLVCNASKRFRERYWWILSNYQVDYLQIIFVDMCHMLHGNWAHHKKAHEQ